MTNEDLENQLRWASAVGVIWPNWSHSMFGKPDKLTEPQDMPSRIDSLLEKTYPISYPPVRCGTMQISGGKNVWEVLQEMHSDIQVLQELVPERISFLEQEKVLLESQLTLETRRVEVLQKENARLQSELDNGIKVDIQIDIKGSKLEVSREEMRQSIYRMLKKHSQDILAGRVQDD